MPKNKPPWGDRWKMVNTLGEGGQAQTHKVIDLKAPDGDSTIWVLKALKNDNRIERFKREISAQRRLRSTNIAAIEDWGWEPGPFLVTRYLGPDLTKASQLDDPTELLERFRGIVVGVRDAHFQGVIHRDIKPNNIVVADDGTPYLIDFGICADDESAAMLTASEAFGNAAFAAPECGLGSVDSAREPSDIYSLGKLLYWMASGRKHIVREDFDEAGLVVSNPLARQYFSVIVERTVREDPGSRWTASQVVDQVDWALEKLGEHSAIRAAGSDVLVDGFGPNNASNDGGSRSATTPPQGNPPGSYEVAEALFPQEPVELERLDLGLRRVHGTGRVVVSLIQGGAEVPSDNPADVVEQWSASVTSQTAEVLSLKSVSGKVLAAQKFHWVVLSALDEGNEVAWVCAAEEIAPRPTHLAERDRAGAWVPKTSERGPGMALRALVNRGDHG